MKETRDIDSILEQFEREFSERIEKLVPDRFFDELLAEKNRQINELRTLPENAEILRKLKELEEIKASYVYRFIEKMKFILLSLPPVRWALFLLRKAV
jgi:hypothetical protein